MGKRKYDNFWTQLDSIIVSRIPIIRNIFSFDKLRGNMIFRGIWRYIRIATLAGALAFVDVLVPGIRETLMGIEIIAPIVPIMFAGMPIALEKWIRELIPITDF